MFKFYSEKILLTEPFIIQRKLPVNFVESDDKLFKPILTDSSRAVNVYFAENIYLMKLVLMKGLRFIEDDASIFRVFLLPMRGRIKRIVSFFVSKTEIIEKGIWITNSWSHTYFHWFADVLPKLLAVENKIRGHKVLLPESYKEFHYIEYSLRKLGFEYFYFDSEIHSVRHLKKYKIKELLIVDHLTYFNPAIMNELRKRFSKNFYPASEPYRKIYISREKAARRKVMNEQEIKQIVKKLGFEIHYFEDYSFEEQLKLITECRYLVSIHGAGLTNILFMKNGTNVMEFKMKEDYINGCYYSLANSLNINYYYLLCEGNNPIAQDADFIIDIEKFTIAIEQMLKGNPQI
jgi:capsular polysaccharide biosynthesis protein